MPSKDHICVLTKLYIKNLVPHVKFEVNILKILHNYAVAFMTKKSIYLFKPTIIIDWWKVASMI